MDKCAHSCTPSRGFEKLPPENLAILTGNDAETKVL